MNGTGWTQRPHISGIGYGQGGLVLEGMPLDGTEVSHRKYLT